MQTSYVSVTDMFCGCGGSSEGAVAAGAEVVLAANHWELAVRSHNANHPNTLHIQADISNSDPRRWPSTTVLIASPECTNHSLAKGKKKPHYTKDLFGNVILDPSEERSRATMWDVPRFAEYHQYDCIIVENVVDVRGWRLFDAWLMAMHALDYEHQCVYINSMFAPPTPQSRDRIYIVFWKRGNRRPDLDLRPLAPCPHCERDVAAVQVWKNPARAWGRYGERGQYVYQCPDCRRRLHPYYWPALTAIDWSLPTPRIGDRGKPLKAKTLDRIRLGLERYHDCYLVLNTQYSHATNNRSVAVEMPWPTQTAQQAFALIAPLIGANRAHGVPHPVDEVAQTVAAGGNHLFLLTPAFLTRHYSSRGGDATLSRGLDETLGSVTTQDHHSLTVAPAFLLAQRGSWRLSGLDEPLGTQVANGAQHSMVVPPAMVASYYHADRGHALDEALPTIPTKDHHALVTMPFFLSAYGDKPGYARNPIRPVSAAAPTIPAVACHRLAVPGPLPAVEDCGFRMLEPHEIKRAMAFRDDYVVYGNKRERIKQLGNAVTPPVMQLLVERCLATLN